jgi:ethanolamine utilization cobalamin adenosyltransferase
LWLQPKSWLEMAGLINEYSKFNTIKKLNSLVSTSYRTVNGAFFMFKTQKKCVNDTTFPWNYIKHAGCKSFTFGYI